MVDNKLLLAGAAIAIYLLSRSGKSNGKKFAGVKGEGEFFLDPNYNPGVRYNNPGNIKWTDTPWKGEIWVPRDPRIKEQYKVFATKKAGVRAMYLNLRTYYNKYKLRNIRDILYKWAIPPNPNYVDFVSKATGIAPTQELEFTRDYYPGIAMAMAVFENRQAKLRDPITYFPANLFREAWIEEFE